LENPRTVLKLFWGVLAALAIGVVAGVISQHFDLKY
jgi:hypothetical protein